MFVAKKKQTNSYGVRDEPTAGSAALSILSTVHNTYWYRRGH